MLEKQLSEWLFNQASYYIDYLKPEKSIILLEAIQLLEPHRLDVDRMLSYAYLQVHEYEKCIQSANKFLASTQSAKNSRAIKWIKGRAIIGFKKQKKLNEIGD